MSNQFQAEQQIDVFNVQESKRKIENIDGVVSLGYNPMFYSRDQWGSPNQLSGESLGRQNLLQ
eukprot:10812517-Karenia_brevis.AAC.1